MKKELIDKLHTGNYSCVISHQGEIRTFTQHGIADLYDLLTQEPEFLQGAQVADKVVGKGAAALMLKGGIGELYADLISTKALELIRKQGGVEVSFAEEVPFIWNRNHTGGCPVETLCGEETSIDTLFNRIKQWKQQLSSSIR